MYLRDVSPWPDETFPGMGTDGTPVLTLQMHIWPSLSSEHAATLCGAHKPLQLHSLIVTSPRIHLSYVLGLAGKAQFHPAQDEALFPNTE